MSRRASFDWLASPRSTSSTRVTLLRSETRSILVLRCSRLARLIPPNRPRLMLSRGVEGGGGENSRSPSLSDFIPRVTPHASSASPVYVCTYLSIDDPAAYAALVGVGSFRCRRLSLSLLSSPRCLFQFARIASLVIPVLFRFSRFRVLFPIPLSAHMRSNA